MHSDYEDNIISIFLPSFLISDVECSLTVCTCGTGLTAARTSKNPGSCRRHRRIWTRPTDWSRKCRSASRLEKRRKKRRRIWSNKTRWSCLRTKPTPNSRISTFVPMWRRSASWALWKPTPTDSVTIPSEGTRWTFCTTTSSTPFSSPAMERWSFCFISTWG